MGCEARWWLVEGTFEHNDPEYTVYCVDTEETWFNNELGAVEKSLSQLEFSELPGPGICFAGNYFVFVGKTLDASGQV